MKTKLNYLLLLLLFLKACTTPSTRIPACEPNEVTQDEYATTGLKGLMPTLWAFNDYEEGIACAQQQNKPVFLAFTAFGARTRYFPDMVLQERRIVDYLTNDFVPIILYVDDRQRIPIEEIQTENGVRTLRNVGNLNAYLQEQMFQKASQPYLVLMTWEGELLTEPVGYFRNPKDYINVFDAALESYAKMKLSKN